MPVGVNYKGVGRSVYPGIIQLSSFISMNFKTHLNSFFDQVFREIEGIASENDRHNKFYKSVDFCYVLISWWGIIKVTQDKNWNKTFSTHHTNMNQCAFEKSKSGGSNAF